MIIFISFFFFLRTESLGWKTSEEKKQRTNPGIQGGVSLLPRLAGEEPDVDKARASCHSTQRRRPRGALPRLSHLCRPVFLFRDSLSSVSSVTCSKEELCDA